jgi:uncharacterized damage-inducible protein DinB
MADPALPLTAFYACWGGHQQSLVGIIAPLSPAQLALPTAPHHWSIGMVVRHIIAARVFWFRDWMGEREPVLAATHVRPTGEDGPPALESAALVAGLEQSWQMIAETLARWTPADLGHRFSPPASLSEEERRIYGERTREWIIWHVLEHDIHHGGELSLALGGYGLEGIYDVQL